MIIVLYLILAGKEIGKAFCFLPGDPPGSFLESIAGGGGGLSRSKLQDRRRGDCGRLYSVVYWSGEKGGDANVFFKTGIQGDYDAVQV